jgi:multiple sugar transport system substrate-binding protein
VQSRACPALVGLVMGLVLILTGCGGSPIDESTDGVPPAEATGTLRVLVPSYPASNEGKQAFEAVAEKFNRIYPKMRVEPDYATYSNLNEKISTSIAAGIPYDVMVVGVGWIPPFAAKRIFTDLERFGVDEQALTKRSVPAMVPTAMYDGKVYGVPLVADARVMALRKSAFREAGLDPNDPPQTLAEIRAAAKKLTERNDAGTITRPGLDLRPGDGGTYRQVFLTMLAATGTPLYNGAEPNFNNAKGVETLNWFKSVIDDVQVYGQTTASGDPMVYTGDAAMGITGGAIDCSEDGFGQENCDDLTYFLPDDGTPAEFVGGDLAAVGARSQHQEAAWTFIEQLTQRESLDKLAELNTKLPAYADVVDSPQAKSNPLSMYAAKHLNDVAYEGGPINWLDLRPKFDAKLSQAILGQKTPEDALAELAQQSQTSIGGN